MTRIAALPFRNDTMLGVCQAIGEDFGFHPNWLRILFGGLFYFSPVGVIGAYLGLGVVVAMSRWVFPAEPAVASTGVGLRATPPLARAT